MGETLTDIIKKRVTLKQIQEINRELKDVIEIQTIKDVLANAATEEVMTAWTEAYQVLAEVFINREHKIYQTVGH
jgi:hemoglobin-like flavoprotein